MIYAGQIEWIVEHSVESGNDIYAVGYSNIANVWLTVVIAPRVIIIESVTYSLGTTVCDRQRIVIQLL